MSSDDEDLKQLFLDKIAKNFAITYYREKSLRKEKFV